MGEGVVAGDRRADAVKSGMHLRMAGIAYVGLSACERALQPRQAWLCGGTRLRVAVDAAVHRDVSHVQISCYLAVYPHAGIVRNDVPRI